MLTIGCAHSGCSISGDAYYLTRPRHLHAAAAIPDEVWGILNASGADRRMSEAECGAVVDELIAAAEEHLPKIATQHTPQVLS